jgi:hypothetical protein
MYLESLYIGEPVLTDTCNKLEKEGITVEYLKTGILNEEKLKSIGLCMPACTMILYSYQSNEKV